MPFDSLEMSNSSPCSRFSLTEEHTLKPLDMQFCCMKLFAQVNSCPGPFCDFPICSVWFMERNIAIFLCHFSFFIFRFSYFFFICYKNNIPPRFSRFLVSGFEFPPLRHQNGPRLKYSFVNQLFNHRSDGHCVAVEKDSWSPYERTTVVMTLVYTS